MGDNMVDLTTRADAEAEVVYVNADGTTEQPSDEDAPEKKEGRGKVAAAPVKRKDWPEDLIKKAGRLIDQEFIDGGGDYREDQKGTIYWLDLDHLVEFELADKRFGVDKDFWDWFRTYRETHGVEARKGSRKWVSSFGDYKYENHDRNYMTSWWGGWGYKASSEATQKLAIAVGAVNSIVSVINDTGKPFKTRLASGDDREAPKSFTTFDTQEVVVSPQALLDPSIPEDEGIEVTAGWGLHEGSHVRFTSQLLDVLTLPSVLKPIVTSAHLFNLLEDVRIESKTSEQFPGFEGYFDKANSYLWDVTKHLAPTQWGPTLADKMNVITASVKWGTEYGQIVAAAGDQKLKDEYVWFSAWSEKYRIEKKDARRSLIEALSHMEEDDDTKKQMADQSKREEKLAADSFGKGTGGLTEKEFRDLLKDIKELLRDGKGKSPFEPCPSPLKQGRGDPGKKPIRLTPDQADEIEELIRQELTKATTTVGTTAGKDQITIIKPVEDDQSRATYIKPGPMVGRLKSAFVFRKTVPEWFDRAQRSGQLDENELWKIVGNDLRVFERRVTADTPNTQVTMLVDMSSSMRGENMRKAQDLANTMLECLKTMKGVTVRVRGHNHTPAVMIYRIWEQGDPQTRLGLIGKLCAGSTPDGYALDWCSQELMANHKPGEDMVLIILSDGMPNVAPAGTNAPDHVHQVVEHFRQRGITTVSIGLGRGVTGQDTMYRNYIQYESDQKLPTQLTKLLIKLFGGATQ